MPPLIPIAVAWVTGLVMAHHWLVPHGTEPVSVVLLSLVPLGALVLWHRDRDIRLGSACALALCLGLLRYQTAVPDLADPGFMARYNDQGWATVEGTVHGYPDVRDSWTNLELEAGQIEIGGQVHPVRGRILVRAPRYPAYGYGDRLRVSGNFETPPELEGFSYRDYLARQGIYSYISRPRIEALGASGGSAFWQALFAFKDRARASIARLIPEPEAALMQGILLGIETGIPTDLYEAYNTTGTSHIIVISGSNITIISALFAAAFGRLMGKRRAYWFTITGIVLYVLLVGADSAVVRAGVMGGLYVTALYLGRRSTAYVSLFASAIFLTTLNPLALWDAGFQLSFAATLGLILFTPVIERLFERLLARRFPRERVKQILRFLNDILIVTLAAQILTVPLVIYHFGRFSLVAPVTNLLILPAQPPVMIWGGAAALLDQISLLEPVARLVAWFPWLCLAYTNLVVDWMAGWPLASLQIARFGSSQLALTYTAILMGVWTMQQRHSPPRRLWNWLTRRRSTTALLGAPLVATLLIWLAVLQLPDGQLHVAFLDVGQGDAILITTPDGQQLLVDGGPSPTALTAALGREMPFWDRSIDLLILTHPDSDHITGLIEVLGRYRVERWLDNGRPGDDALYAACQELLAETAIPRHVVRQGDRLDLGRGISLEVLHPPRELMVGSDADANNNSVVLRLVWDEASFLLTGDVEAEAEELLLRSGQLLEADVLKVGHHGSGGSSTAEFLAGVAPAYAVISVGADNHFGHPQPAVLERLAQQGVGPVLRTDEQGTIEFTTDGQRLWIRTRH